MLFQFQCKIYKEKKYQRARQFFNKEKKSIRKQINSLTLILH